MPDLGVHERRSRCSRSADPAVHDAPILAFTIDRNPQIREARDAAEAEGRRLAARASEVESEAAASRAAAETAKAKRRAALVVAAIDGGARPDPKPAAEAAIDAEDARVVADELRREAKAKSDEAAKRHGELRGAVAALADKCMQRAGVDFLAAARRVGELHALITAAHDVADVRARLGGEWEAIMVPGTTVLDALRNVCTVRDVPNVQLPLVGGDTAMRKAKEAALDAAKAAIRDRLGEWPAARR